MKKPLPETRLTHERIGSKVMRDDPMTPMTQTKEQVSEKARELFEEFVVASDLFRESGDSVAAMRTLKADYALRGYVASLEADAKRLDWLQEHFAGSDFAYGENEDRCVLVIDLPLPAMVNASLRETVDLASPITDEVSR